jgi:putative zinc finger/helix-turn-helix YgiT family protein
MFNMICFKCNSEEFEVREESVRQEFRGEQFDVKAPISVCKTCGWQTFGPGQTDAVRKQTVEAYRSKHGLLTSAEIVLRRKKIGKSQSDFAKFIGVGVASVKRWERGFVQEPIYDSRIREKCDFIEFKVILSRELVEPKKAVFIKRNCSVSSVWIFAGSGCKSSPVVIQSNSFRLTNRLTKDAVRAEASKNWRKSYANFEEFPVGS